METDILFHNVRVWPSLYAENEKNACFAWQLSMCRLGGEFMLYMFTCWEMFLDQSCFLYTMTSVFSWPQGYRFKIRTVALGYKLTLCDPKVRQLYHYSALNGWGRTDRMRSEKGEAQLYLFNLSGGREAVTGEVFIVLSLSVCSLKRQKYQH